MPAKLKNFSKRIGQKIQSEFIAYKGLEEKAADPALLQKTQT